MTDKTNELKLELLLRLPWTIRVERDDDGTETLGVVELPAVIGAGDTPKELVDDLWEAMRAVLGAYLEEGMRPPLPAGVTELPWERPASERRFVLAMQAPVQVPTSMATFGTPAIFNGLQPA